MYERILVPLDGSDLAEAVLAHVIPIAEKFGSDVLILRSVPTLAEIIGETLPRESFPSSAGQSASVDVARDQYDLQQAEAQAYLEKQRQALAAKGLKVSIELLESSSAAAAILDAAQRTDSDLIAMSTHGRSGLGRAVFGSVADEVLRKAKRPVLLIRTEE
jgi:nucleotide-binding universal stress UspA family protein